ncbi:MAG: hypothetical protein CH6_0547 [Candidatus Kapaibacterium sp.]|nr:MAG: hypothetical protein CH6_0547 [Candidatus Kapabacteria bacterium]
MGKSLSANLPTFLIGKSKKILDQKLLLIKDKEFVRMKELHCFDFIKSGIFCS